MDKKTTLIGLAFLASNAVTAFACLSLGGWVVKKEQQKYDETNELLHQSVRNTRIQHQALLEFCRNTPEEISKPILDRLEFDWVTRDVES